MASLQIPIAIWKGGLELDVTAIQTNTEEGWIFLGLKQGHIVRLNVNAQISKLHLSMLLLGHQNSIVDMAITVQKSDQQEALPAVLLSLDRRGEVALWSIDDGRCLLHNVMAIDGEARGFLLTPRSEYAFVYGHTSFINVIRVATLEVVQSVPLPVWVSCAQVLEAREEGTEIIMFPTMAGAPIKFTFDEDLGKVVSSVSIITDWTEELTESVVKCTKIGDLVCCATLNMAAMISKKSDGALEMKQLLRVQDTLISDLIPLGDKYIAIRCRDEKVFIFALKNGTFQKHELSTKESVFSTRLVVAWKNELLIMRLSPNHIHLGSLSGSLSVETKLIDSTLACLD